MKTCTKCGLEKDESEFYKRDNRPSRTVSSCKKCCLERLNAWRKTPEGQLAVKRYQESPKGRSTLEKHNKSDKKKALVKAYRQSPEGKRSVRSAKLKQKYGITADDYDRMLHAQDGCCAICRTTDPGRGYSHFCLDHDHVTFENRGLLCHSCNVLLANAKDSIELLNNAIAYLTRKTHEHSA